MFSYLRVGIYTRTVLWIIYVTCREMTTDEDARMNHQSPIILLIFFQSHLTSVTSPCLDTLNIDRAVQCMFMVGYEDNTTLSSVMCCAVERISTDAPCSKL